MKKTALLVILIAALANLPGQAQKNDRAEVLLEAAGQKASLQGDLQGAIKQYKDIATRFASNRTVAATALIRMAECYQKLGDSESRRIYEQVVREYADQKDAVTVARARLGGSNAASSDALAKRLVCTDCGDSELHTDGRWIVFTDWDSGDLSVRDLSTGQVKRLMAKPGSWKDSPAYCESPVFSPDLREVAYLWDAGENPRRVQLKVIPNEPGAKPRVLVDNSEYTYLAPQAWTSDGKSILAMAHKRDRTWQLDWISAANGVEKPLKSLQWRLQGVSSIPQISPDGRFIAYAALAVNPSKLPSGPADPLDQHIYLLATDGSSETEVVKTAGLNKAPLWTPDGKHILFTSDRSGAVGLWSIAVENGKPAGAPLLINPNLGSGKLWPNTIARSGAYYYSQSSAGVEQISIASLTGGTQSMETLVGVNPAWSPDGKSVAFKRHHPGSENYYDLVVHSLETGDEKILPTALGFTGAAQPVWFRDGRGIITGLGGSRPPVPGTYRVDLGSGEWRQITPLGLTPLSPDDKIHYIVGNKGVSAVDLAAGTERQVLAVPAGSQIQTPLYDNQLPVSPDGRTLAFWRRDSKTRKKYLCIVGVDGANFRDLYSTDPDGDTRIGYLAWTKDGHTILFSEPHEEKGRIMRISAQGGTPEFTGIQAKGSIQRFDLSPDGLRVVYSSATTQQVDMWALDNVLAAVK